MRNKDADVILFIDVLLDEEVTAFFLMMIHRLFAKFMDRYTSAC
jgi:hypothetical protein